MDNSDSVIRRRAAAGILAVIAILATACGTTSGAAPAPGERLSLVVGTRDVTAYASSLYWAKAQGYFDKENLDVSIKVGEAAHTAQLVSGQTDLYWGAQGGLFGIINSGKPVQTIYGVDAGAYGYVVTANKAIKTPAECRTVSTSTPGTVVHAWTRQLENIYHVKWELSQLTSVPAVAANVVSGHTDCAVGNVNWYQSAIEAGQLAVILDPADKSKLPQGWPTLGVEDVVGGLPATLHKKAPAVERFLRAYDKARKDFIAADPKGIAQSLMSFDAAWKTYGSVDVLATAIEEFRPFLSPNDGFVSAETWSKTLDFFKAGGLDFISPDTAELGYAKAVDMSYFKTAIGQR
ncbi:ABC transporter substrate-binding protein [Amycolatopsis pithecellobii]|uniref:SsuA/THI5-like domain-containing protein n=1 Tax=Amycolatopsis pithecellobii TaxID=664692 RepID=A0A6N7Z901_9PSEU|nr:ABC transporter substrate-binding protein [Amycolatopsis pithecellobii]MTD57576.1 hypothetical protein [Amycolatopsis pithecellobii]